MIRLNKKIGSYLGGFFVKFLKGAISAAVMGIAAYGTVILMQNLFPGDSVVARILTLGVPAAAGVVVYAVMLVIMRVDVAAGAVKKIFGKKD